MELVLMNLVRMLHPLNHLIGKSIATVELPGIKAMWSLRESFSAKNDTYLVQSFIGETRILSFESDNLCETEIQGFHSDVETLCVCNLKSNLFLQVTPNEAR